MDKIVRSVSAARRRFGKAPSEADLAVTLASAGAWKGLVNAAALKREIKEVRGSSRLPIQL